MIRVLVDPGEQARVIRQLIIGVQNANEGFFLPMFGRPGVGKTTLAQNLSFFYPKDFAPTLLYGGVIDRESLVASVREHKATLPANDQRILPINIDHREKDPPSDKELAVLKSFLRESIDGSLCLMIWPSTDHDIAEEMSQRFRNITGPPFIPIPHIIAGPSRDTWRETVLNTLALCNGIPPEEIRELGVDPYDYDPEQFATIGDFIKRIATEFSQRVAELLTSLDQEVTLVVVFVCESLDRGVLTEFTHGNEAGLLDSHALVKACAGSRIGKWWSDRRGALTQTVFRTNAHAFWVSPAATVTILRRYGPLEVQRILGDMAVGDRDSGDVQKYIGRSDLGKFLQGDVDSRYVTQGKPPRDARDALAFVGSDFGYGGGKDKLLNAAMAAGLETLLSSAESPVSVKAEQGVLSGLVPDNSIATEGRLICVEYAWRSGDCLASANRSDAAQYILTKLKHYAVSQGWVTD